MSTVSASNAHDAPSFADKANGSGKSQISYNREMFSDPGMRPYLEEYFNAKMEPMRERIAEMEAAEARGEASKTVKTADGRTATELGASFYKAAMMDFDDWLTLHSDPDSPLNRIFRGTGMAEMHLDYLEENGPDSSSDVAVVFASRSQGIVGHVGDEGGVASHAGAEILRWIADQANELRLTGQERIDYVKEQGLKALKAVYGDIEVVDYRNGERPTKRDFMARWYPSVDVDRDYAMQLREAREQLAQAQSMEQNRLRNRDELVEFVVQMMSDVPSKV
ncbi:hypothetical protein [Nisaea sediminum]|uniref:hypothetical protein n=1 Tax=Nisaea sediminum TaxID=2775867 RepID=UPI0018682E08|nr:hypothetical protein [Nisaea sediminum]